LPTSRTGITRAVSFRSAEEIVGADFDGTRLTYATAHCVYMDTVTSRSPTAVPIGTCSQIELSASLASRARTVSASIGCTSAYGERCRGSAVFGTDASRRGRPVVLKTMRFSVLAGHRKTVRFRVSKRALAKLRRVPSVARLGVVDLEVVASATDRGHVKVVARDSGVLTL
jgi:hypothetical protein